MTKEKKHARYLQKKDGDTTQPEIKLFHGDDVEDALKEGWEEPTSQRANGEPWNREPELEGEDTAADMAAEGEKFAAERQAKIDKEKAKKEEAALKAQEKAPEPPKRPDMVVEVIDPKSQAKKAK